MPALRPILFVFLLAGFFGAGTAHAQVAAAPVQAVESTPVETPVDPVGASPDLQNQVTPGMEEYDHVPVGLLAPADAATKTPVVEQPATSLGQIPGLYPIPGTSAEAELKPEDMTFDELKALYRKEKYDVILKPLEQMAASGNHDAEELYGVMLLNAQGVPLDAVKAVGLLTRAAEANKLVAQHYLGNLFYTGKGMEAPDMIRALMWLEVAVARYPDAPQKLRVVKDRDMAAQGMTRLEKTRAQDMARAFLEARDEGHLFEVGR